MIQDLLGHELLTLALGAAAGLPCGFLNTIGSHRGGHFSSDLFWRIGLPVTGGAIIGVWLFQRREYSRS